MLAGLGACVRREVADIERANYRDWDGKGVQSPYADLRGSRTVNDPDATNLMAILLAGSNAPLPVEHAFMSPFARGHSDDELAAVANFVNGFFGNGMAKVTAAATCFLI